MSWRRWLLIVLFVFVLVDQMRYDLEAVERLRHNDRYAREPVFVDGLSGKTVAGPLPEAVERGVKPGDRILAVNGLDYSPTSVLTREVMRRKPGDTIVLRVQTGDQPPRDASIVLGAYGRETDLILTLLLNAFVLLVCLPLAFGVTFIKPRDLRSWILLWMMIGFVPLFRFFLFYSAFWPANLLNYLLNVFLRETWPLAMLMLAYWFPEKLRARSPKFAWVRILIYPLAAFTIVHAVLLFLLSYGKLSSAPLAAAMLPFIRFTQVPDTIIGMSLIGSYFALLGTRFGAVATPEEHRRLVLLNVGSQVAFTPMFILVVRAIVQQSDIFYGVPLWVAITSMLLLLLFPLTLAYLVLVHKVLDIRVVLRAGLRYALATRAVNILRILLLVVVVAAVPRLVSSDETSVERLVLIPVVVFFAIAANRLAQRLKLWMDRRFFREAHNAEQILSELGNEMRRMVEAGPLVETVSRRIAESLHVTHVATLLRNQSGFAPAFALGYDAPLDASFASDAPLARHLDQARVPQRVYLEDHNSWVHRELKDHADRDALSALHSQLLLPIEGNGQLTGFISLGPKRSDEPYSASDVQLLQSVALQAGMALENTRLSAEVASEAAQRELLNQEMEIARSVQERLFPQRRPVVDGIRYAGACRPAESVGGDSYDFLERTGGEFGFSIGDVSGKGVPAAILMAVVQTSIRSNAMAGETNLAALVSNVNRIVEEASPKRHFATLFYGQYDPRSGTLRFVNAAHNPPLLLRVDGSAEWIKPTGLALGWSKRAEFRQSAVSLHAGDVLFLYTDGITEAMNCDKEEFGEARLLEAAALLHTLHPEAIIPAIFHTVDQFTSGEPQHDDMTMVVLQVL